MAARYDSRDDTPVPRAVRVAIVGCGAMGALHARAYGAAGAIVVAGADTAALRRASFAKAFGVRTYRSHTGLMNSHELDAISVTVPNLYHRVVCQEAAKREIAILCEKPLAANAADSLAIVRGSHRVRTFQVGYMRRFDPVVRWFGQQVQELGAIRSAHITCYHPGGTRIPRGSWLVRPRLSGGGVFLHGASHTLDLLLWLAGSSPQAVTAQLRRRRGQRVERIAAGLIEFGTFPATFEAGWLPLTGIGPGMDGWDETITVRAELGFGRLTIPPFALGSSWSAQAEIYHEASGRWRTKRAVRTNLFEREIAAFVRNVRRRVEGWPSARDAHRVDLLIHGAYESARMGKRVTLPGTTSDRDRR